MRLKELKIKTTSRNDILMLQLTKRSA